MKIRTKLYAIVGLSTFSIVLLVGLGFHFSVLVKEKINNADLAVQLIKSTTELAFFTEQYITYGLERS